MDPAPSHSGEMSQASIMTSKHPIPVTTPIDPAARKTKAAFQAMSASAVGLELGVAVIIGLFFGRWLDGKLGTAPWLMIVFLALGFAAGIIGLVRGAKRAEKASADG